MENKVHFGISQLRMTWRIQTSLSSQIFAESMLMKTQRSHKNNERFLKVWKREEGEEREQVEGFEAFNTKGHFFLDS